MAQGRDLGQRAARAPASLRLRRRRDRRAGRARRARLPHGRALLLLPRARRQRRRSPTPAAPREPLAALERDARRTRRGASGPRAPTRSSCSTTRRGSARRCARRPTRSRARRADESDERVAEEAADVLYHLEVLLLSRGVALADVLEVLEWPAPLTRAPRRARPRAAAPRVVPVVERFVDDCETPVSAFLKLRGRAGRLRSCSSPPSRAASAATRSSASARGAMLRWADGTADESSEGIEPRASRTEPDPYGAVAAPARRFRLADRRGAAAVRRRRGRASSATTSCAPSRTSARRTPTRSACPTWR